MIEVGRSNTLQILRETPQGLRLGTDEHNLLLPRRWVPEQLPDDGWLEVFVFTDSEDRLIATTDRPRASVGEFACMEVVDLTPIGAFVDWGLPKDLLVPFRRQHAPLRLGQKVVVAVSLDEATERVIGSTKLSAYLDRDVSGIEPMQAVRLLVYGFNELGALVVVDGRYGGLLYKDRIYQRLRIGQELDGTVLKVRDDGRLDITLQRPGREGNSDAERAILRALDEGQGQLDLHDKSPPEAIQRRLGLSKKAFKRAVGSLYRARTIDLVDGGIRRV